MKYVCPVIVAVLLTAFSVQSASAQVSTLTNADVIRFVAVGMSDQVVTTLINEANGARATKFDLSPSAVADLAAHGVSPAVIAAMRQSSTRTPLSVQSPTAGPQTLAGASALAKAQDAANPLSWKPMLSLGSPADAPQAETFSGSEGVIDRSKFDKVYAACLSMRVINPSAQGSAVTMPQAFTACTTESMVAKGKANTKAEAALAQRYLGGEAWYELAIKSPLGEERKQFSAATRGRPLGPNDVIPPKNDAEKKALDLLAGADKIYLDKK